VKFTGAQADNRAAIGRVAFARRWTVERRQLSDVARSVAAVLDSINCRTNELCSLKERSGTACRLPRNYLRRCPRRSNCQKGRETLRTVDQRLPITRLFLTGGLQRKTASKFGGNLTCVGALKRCAHEMRVMICVDSIKK
jgi:hypothetical protein